MEDQIILPTISVSQNQYEELKEAARRAKMGLREFLTHQLCKTTYPSAKECATPDALHVANEVKDALKDIKEGKVYSFDNIDDAMYALTH